MTHSEHLRADLARQVRTSFRLRARVDELETLAAADTERLADVYTELDRVIAERDDWARQAKQLEEDIGLLNTPPHVRHGEDSDFALARLCTQAILGNPGALEELRARGIGMDGP